MWWNIVNLNKKLLFLLLYFVLSVNIFARFASSCLYSWLLGILLFGRGWRGLFVDILLTKLVSLMVGSIGRDILRDTLFGKSIIRVFFTLKLIQYKLNVPSDNRYSWISVFVYWISSSSYKVLNTDLAIIVFDFSTQIPHF